MAGGGGTSLVAQWLRIHASTVQSLVGELGSHMLSGKGGEGWSRGREGGREEERKRKKIVWRDRNCVLEIRHTLESHLVPIPTLPLPGWVESGMFLKLSEASDSSSGEMMTKYSP